MVIISSHSREQIKFRQVLELENLITAKDDVKVIHSGPLVFIRPKTGYNKIIDQLIKKITYEY